MTELEEINQTVRNYIVLSASNELITKELLEWWYNG